VKGLDKYFEFRYEAAQDGAYFTRACALAIDGVVDEIN
jgi:hypothetical protein